MPEPTMTIPEFATYCRATCHHPAQGIEPEVPCGSEDVHDGERVFRFCGWHWGAVL